MHSRMYFFDSIFSCLKSFRIGLSKVQQKLHMKIHVLSSERKIVQDWNERPHACNMRSD